MTLAPVASPVMTHKPRITGMADILGEPAAESSAA